MPCPHLIKLHLIRTAQSFDHANNHREERQIHADYCLRQQARKPDRIQHHDDHRRDGQDRDGLTGDHPRHHRHVHRAVKHDPHRQQCAKRCAHDKAQESRAEGDPCVIDQRTFRSDLLHHRGFPQLGAHLMRRGQLGLFLRPCVGHQFRKAQRLIGPRSYIPRPLRIERDSRAIPDKDQQPHHRENRDNVTHHPSPCPARRPSRTRCAISRNSGVSRISKGRSRGSGLSITSVILPGRGLITTILVDR